MCGINGAFAYSDAAPAPSADEAVRVRDAMAARGPDGEGLWQAPDGRVVFGHRRLAIIDLGEGGAQPMQSADGRLTVTFNGEIYNYRALRKSLEADGAVLRTESDTEVLLHLYRRHGAEMVHRLQGMFAFGIWDAEARRLFLARDPHGIKPLYYADAGGTLRFASSVRALVAGGGVSRRIDPAGVLGFLAWGAVPEPRTVVETVRALPAGATLSLEASGTPRIRRYWRPVDVYLGAGASSAEDVRAALRSSVDRHLVADVPVGILLSAGVDSTALLGMAADVADPPPHAVTLAFAEFRGRHDDEAPLAGEIAGRYGAGHDVVEISAADARAGLDDFLAAMDQPSIDGLNVYWASHAVRAAGLKAAISGLGGDELFGGYPSFRRYPRIRQVAGVLGRLPARRQWAGPVARLAGPRRRDRLADLLGGDVTPAGAYHAIRGLFGLGELRALVPPELWDAAGGETAILDPVHAALSGAEGRSAFEQIAVAEQSLYMRNQLLRDADWASMGHSLELRVPLVDRTLSETVAPWVARRRGEGGKRPLAEAPARPLPRRILDRPKTGFSMPLQDWVGADCRAGRIPPPPAWLQWGGGDAVRARLVARTETTEVHWGRLWALMVLSRYAEAVGLEA